MRPTFIARRRYTLRPRRKRARPQIFTIPWQISRTTRAVYYDSGAPAVLCKLTNISRRRLVNIRLGMLALFYDRSTTSPEKAATFAEPLIFPDDAGIGSLANRSQTINLAPNTGITLALPNASYHRLLLNPTQRAEAQFPGDTTIRCADVYPAPGTLRSLEQERMQKVPSTIATSPPGIIPTPSPNPMYRLRRACYAPPREQLWIPGVPLQFRLDQRHRETPPLQLPHE
jgi:hypothetical protein